MKRYICMFLATALVASPALAHDPKLHRGPKVEGKVVSVTGNRVVVETTSGTVAVTLNPETKYEQGDAGVEAAKVVLKPGQHVLVSGHKLESGDFAATGVMVDSDGKGESKPHGHE